MEFLIVMLLLVAVACFISSYHVQQTLHKISRWPQAAGRIEKIQIRRENLGGKGGEQPRLYCDYVYDVGERRFKGDRLSYWNENGPGGIKKQRALIQRFQKGSNVLVYYNPANPEESYLLAENSMPKGLFRTACGLLMAVFSIVLCRLLGVI